MEVDEDVGRVVGRGPAAPVVLDESATLPEAIGDERSFGHYPGQVGLGDLGALGDDNVTGTERAAGLTEREVHIE